MKIYEGKITTIGEGTWNQTGATLYSVIQIGDHHLRSIVATNYLSSYLHLNQPTKILVSTGISKGLFTKKFIYAVEVNGKKYKEGASKTMLTMGLKILGYFILGVPLMMFLSPFLSFVPGLVAAYHYVKEYVDYTKF